MENKTQGLKEKAVNKLASIKENFFNPKLNPVKSIGNLVKNNFDDLAQFRNELGLPKAGSDLDKSTLAKLQIGDETFYGINGHCQKVTLKVREMNLQLFADEGTGKTTTKIDYKEVFFEQNPELRGEVVVHHGIEQQVLKRLETKGLFKNARSIDVSSHSILRKY